VEAQRQCPSQTPIRKSRTGLNLGTGVATTLAHHLLVLCVLYWTPYLLLLSPSSKSGQQCARAFPLKKLKTVSPSIDIRITMISGVVYLLRIFKMFHRLLNNPVLCLLNCIIETIQVSEGNMLASPDINVPNEMYSFIVRSWHYTSLENLSQHAWVVSWLWIMHRGCCIASNPWRTAMATFVTWRLLLAQEQRWTLPLLPPILLQAQCPMGLLET